MLNSYIWFDLIIRFFIYTPYYIFVHILDWYLWLFVLIWLLSLLCCCDEPQALMKLILRLLRFRCQKASLCFFVRSLSDHVTSKRNWRQFHILGNSLKLFETAVWSGGLRDYSIIEVPLMAFSSSAAICSAEVLVKDPKVLASQNYYH